MIQGCFHEGKSAGAWTWPGHSSLYGATFMNGAVPLLPQVPSWNGQGQFYVYYSSIGSLIMLHFRRYLWLKAYDSTHGVTCDWRHMAQHMVLLVTEGIWLNTWCYLWLKAYGWTHGITCDWRHMAQHMALLVTEGIWLNTWCYLWLKAYGSTHGISCDWRHVAQHMALLVTEGIWLNTWHYLWLKTYGSTHNGADIFTGFI